MKIFLFDSLKYIQTEKSFKNQKSNCHQNLTFQKYLSHKVHNINQTISKPINLSYILQKIFQTLGHKQSRSEEEKEK